MTKLGSPPTIKKVLSYLPSSTVLTEGEKHHQGHRSPQTLTVHLSLMQEALQEPLLSHQQAKEQYSFAVVCTVVSLDFTHLYHWTLVEYIPFHLYLGSIVLKYLWIQAICAVLPSYCHPTSLSLICMLSLNATLHFIGFVVVFCTITIKLNLTESNFSLRNTHK